MMSGTGGRKGDEFLFAAKSAGEVGAPSINILHFPFAAGNPYQRQLMDNLEALGIRTDCAREMPRSLSSYVRRGGYNAVHIHWHDWCYVRRTLTMSVLELARFVFELRRLQRMNVRICWTIHNFTNHDSPHPLLSRIGGRILASLANGIIVHSPSLRARATAFFGQNCRDKLHVVPVGNFIDAYENSISKDEARRRLGLSAAATVFLFLGAIRPYKGVPELIDAFKELRERDVVLLIAGAVSSKGMERALRSQIAGDPRIGFYPGHVHDQDIQIYLNACDVVVLPFRAISTSASVILAMSFARACVVPRLGFIEDVIDEQGAFLYDPTVVSGLPGCLATACAKKGHLPDMGMRNLTRAREWEWGRIAVLTREAYLQAFASGKSSRLEAAGS